MTYNRKFLFLFSLLTLGLVTLLLSCTQTPEQRAKNATVLMVIGNADGSVGMGSGFFVKRDKIVTNIHVVDNARMVFAVGTKKVYNVEKVTGYDPKRDVVILKVSGKGNPLELGKGQIDDPIFVTGYPDGGYEKTIGTVIGIRQSDEQLRLGQTNGSGSILAAGNSGGPVLNGDGQVIGIAVISDGDYGYASTSNVLNALLVSLDEENLSIWQKKDPILASAYVAWSKEKLDSENYDEAIKGLDEAINLYPKYANAYHKRGAAKTELGQYQAAIKDYKKAIELISR